MIQRFFSHKALPITLIILSLSIIGFLVYTQSASRILSPTPDNELAKEATPEEIPGTVRMIFVGDIMLDRGVASSVRRNFNNDFHVLFEHLDMLREGDIVFGNLEGPISDQGRNVGSRFFIPMDPATLPALQRAGFTIFSLANNHMGDWSMDAFTDTMRRLRDTGILFTGAGMTTAEAEQATIIEKNGIRIGFIGVTDVGPNWLAATESRPGILLASHPRIEEIITRAAAETDILVVTPHWGDEYVPFNNRQQTLARMFIDAGADMVIGHHPHVIQDIEYYNEKLIAYSLGNFIFDQYFSEETMRGMILDITVDAHGIVNMTTLTSVQERTYKPITVRPLIASDIVRRRITVPSLCPPASGTGENKWLFPVDRNRSLGNYIPPTLTHMPNRVETRGTATCLTTEAADALEKMFLDMNNAGLKPVMTSGYRSFDIQRMVYTDWLSKQGDILPEFPSVAEPGHSEHQLGTTVDIKSLQTPDFSYAAFVRSPEYAWLQNNAHRYGFVQSYTEGNEFAQGYIAEPWHWRYIGRERATAFRDSSLTLNHWLAQFLVTDPM
ncbi:MAG: CapA family protein [Candidatus Pacebacteria bacterium]|nr:CapA family protein [Candidatus Paceibacterota bacterium]